MGLGVSGSAFAQYGATAMSGPAVGEEYHVEVAAGWWSPSPDLIVSSESLGIIGSQIDAVDDLGIVKKGFGEFRAVLRPARKHKFRIHYLPLDYDSSSIFERDITFNGQLFHVGLPVNSSFSWKTWRFGYEYDFISRDRWYLGVIGEAKYTDINVELESVVGSEFTRVRGPIPAIGVAGRAYVAPMIAISGELTGSKVLNSLIDTDRYDGHYLDYDIYGLVNFNNYVGAQVGYRSIDVNVEADSDTGTLKVTGLYFMGVVRF
jgi:hypothetical protein